MRLFSAGDEFRGKLAAASSKELEPMFCTKQPSQILVSKFANPTSPSDIKATSVEEFCQQEKISWCESPLVAKKIRDQNYAVERLDRVDSEVFKAHYLSFTIAEVLLNPRDDLVICKMDDKVGKGLMLSPYAQRPIKAGDIIGLYPGVCTENNTLQAFLSGGSNFSHYGIEIEPGCPLTCIRKAYNDAIVWRNHCAYLQHAPSVATLKALKIDSAIKKRVVTSNVVSVASFYLGFPVMLLIAIDDIAPGKHLYFDYGDAYWSNSQATADGKGGYYLFDGNAKILGRLDGDAVFKISKASKANRAPKTSGKKSNHTVEKRPAMSEDEAIGIYRSNVDKPLKNYQELFATNVRKVIEHYLQRKPQGEILTYTNKILSLDCTNVETFFMEIAKIINSKEFESLNIHYLSGELSLCMQAFNIQRKLSGLNVLVYQEQQDATKLAQAISLEQVVALEPQKQEVQEDQETKGDQWGQDLPPSGSFAK